MPKKRKKKEKVEGVKANCWVVKSFWAMIFFLLFIFFFVGTAKLSVFFYCYCCCRFCFCCRSCQIYFFNNYWIANTNFFSVFFHFVLNNVEFTIETKLLSKLSFIAFNRCRTVMSSNGTGSSSSSGSTTVTQYDRHQH